MNLSRSRAPDLARSIADGLAALGLDDAPADRLAAFLKLLSRWNKAYNLTAVRDPAEMVVRHIIDSAAVLPWIAGPRVLDAGTGAGFPGVPIALLDPATEVELLDASAKKTRFLVQAAAELGLTNVSVRHGRLETYQPRSPFDTVVSRALTALDDFVALSGHLIHPGGRLVAMKGKRPDEELAALRPGWGCRVSAVTVPGLAAERHVVVMCPTDATTQD